MRLALQRVTGAYAIAVVSSEQPDVLIGARLGGGPLIVGIGEGEQFLASDIPAILKHTRRVLILDEGEIVSLRPGGVSISKIDGTPVQREPMTIEWNVESAEKGGYPHFVLKEIHEQPEAMRRALTGRIREGQLHLAELEQMKQAGLLDKMQRIVIVACGTSYHAGLIAKYVIEQWARIPVETITAAEFRYCNPIVGPETLCIAVTQSGETADTLVGIRQAREQGAPVIAITNVVASAITRLVRCGIVPASRAGDRCSSHKDVHHVRHGTLPAGLIPCSAARAYGEKRWKDAGGAGTYPQPDPAYTGHCVTSPDDSIEPLAKRLSHSSSMMFIGRGVGFPQRWRVRLSSRKSPTSMPRACPPVS